MSKFIIGTKGLSHVRYNELMLELEQSKDLIYFHDFDDNYNNLTLKLLLSLVWAHGNHHFDYLIKCDDDTFVQLDRLVTSLHRMDCPELLYWGYFNGRGYPHSSGKWVEREWFLCPHFIPYAMGGGYVLSWQLVDLIARFSHTWSMYKNEDVTVGTWMSPFRAHRYHDIRFNTEGHSHGCNNNYIITHKEKAATFIQKKKSLTSNGTLCKIEREVRPSYLYNWSVSPPLCCDRKYGIPVPN